MRQGYRYVEVNGKFSFPFCNFAACGAETDVAAPDAGSSAAADETHIPRLLDERRRRRHALIGRRHPQRCPPDGVASNHLCPADHQEAGVVLRHDN